MIRCWRPAQALGDIRNPSFVSFLDLARWSAAAIVFFGHLRDPLFFGYDSIAGHDRNIAVKLWYFVTGWDGAAVIVFFVLSGFLVGALGCAKASLGRFSVSDYAVDRLTRLFVAYWPALLLTVVLDGVGIALLSQVGFWNHTQPMLLEKVHTAPFQAGDTPALLLANALMLQTFFTNVFGSNQPLWTISAEFWFYAVFGVVLTTTTISSLGWRAALLVVGAIMTVVLGMPFVALFGLWLIGVAAGLVSAKALQRPLAATLLLLAVLVATRLRQDLFKNGAGLQVRDYAIALSFAWLLVSMRSKRFRWLERLQKPNQVMASFSYSLYLIHFPLMLFIMGALYATGSFRGIATGYSPTSAQGLAVYAFVILAVYACAYAFAALTERQTPRLRRRLKAAFRPAAALGANVAP